MKKTVLLKALDKYDDTADVIIRIEGDEYEITGVAGTWDVADDGYTKIEATSVAFIDA